jgi:hypothetical protein
VKLGHGRGRDASRQIRDQDGWDEHAAFMDGLVEDGFIILGSPVGDGERTCTWSRRRMRTKSRHPSPKIPGLQPDCGGFGYNPNAGTVSLSPYAIQVDTADQAAKDLSWAIYQAAREVDQANAGELLTRTVGVLNNVGISCASTSSEEASLWV